MGKTAAEWLTKKYIDWIYETGEDKTRTEFAELLDLGRVTVTRYMNGNVKNIEYPNALQIAQRLKDYEILDILGYPRPDERYLLGGLSEDLRSLFSTAINEARSELVKRGITTGGQEAAEIVSTAFARHGLSINVEDKED